MSRLLLLLLLPLWAMNLAAAAPARAQASVWDATISNTNWYVPAPHLLAYAAPAAGFVNPVPIGDQTLWTLVASTNGVFTGTSFAELKIGPVVSTDTSTIQGTITTDGRITMIFTPVGGGVSTVGLGQMRMAGGVPAMQMQMITGDALLVTHWAAMLPYDPLTFTPPRPEVHFSPASPQWAWTAGTPWRIVSPALFGSATPGRFVITDYQSGYFWGRGVGPTGTFIVIGSITPDGKVLLATLSQGTLTSLYGDVTGSPAAAQMMLSAYDALGNLSGGLATVSLIRPFGEVLARLNNHAGAGAAETLYRLMTRPESFGGAMAPVLAGLSQLDGQALSTAIGQTLPVLSGDASRATFDAQRGLSQVVASRLDGLRGLGFGDPQAARRNAWLQPLGGIIHQAALDGVAGYDANGAGLAAGVDGQPSPGLLLGGLVAYSHHAISGSEAAVPGSLAVSAWHAGLYGAYALRPNLDMTFQLGGALNRSSTRRSIAFMGPTASAAYDSYTLHGGVALRAVLPVGPDLALMSMLRADYGQVRADGYSETGAGALNLTVDGQLYRELTLGGGLKAAYRLAGQVFLSAEAGVGYNTLGEQARITASYSGGGAPFVTYGIEVSPWLFNAGLGLTGFQQDRLELGLRYGIQASPSGFLGQTGSAVLKVRL